MKYLRAWHGATAFLFLACLWSSNLIASSLIVERSFYEDSTASKTIEDVQNLDWQVFEGVFSKGYSESAYWIRLKVAGNAKDSDLPWVLQIKPTFIDEVTIWDSHDPGYRKVVGDRHPWINNEFPNFNFNVVLAKAKEPRYVWLRVKTTSTNLMDIQIQEMDDFIQSSAEQTNFYVFVIVFLSALFLLSLLSLMIRPDFLRATFAVYQLMAVIYAAAYTGVLRASLHHALFPSFLDYLTSFSIFNYTFASIFFYKTLLKEYQPQSWCLLYFNLFLAIYPMQLLMLFSGHVDWALKTNALLILMAPMFSLIALYWGVDWSQSEYLGKYLLPKKLLLIFYALLVLSLWSAVLPALNWLEPLGYQTDMLLVHGLVTGSILTVLMFLREQHIRFLRRGGVKTPKR